MLQTVEKYIAQFMKFGAVGSVAFLIDYSVLAFCAEVLGIDYLTSATIGFMVSVVFNYFASMRYVFTRREELSRRREFAIFVVLSLIGLALNNVVMWACVEFASFHYLVAKIVSTAAVTLWNFFSRKRFLDAG